MREFVFLFMLSGTCHATYDELSYDWVSISKNNGISDFQEEMTMYKESKENDTVDVTALTSLLHNSTTPTALRSRGKKGRGHLHKKKYSLEDEESSEEYESSGLDSMENIEFDHIPTLMTREEVQLCVDGVTKRVGCHVCFCVGGQLYICSSQQCPYMTSASNTEEPALRNHKLRRRRRRKCTAGQQLPSPDNCNTCECLNGKAVCTMNVCGPIVTTEYRHCLPKKWHNLHENSTCKECYCIDGATSFCYLDYCSTRVELLLKEKAKIHQLSLPVSSANCKPGKTKRDECTRCECTAHNKWRCRSEPSLRCPGISRAVCEPDQYFTLGTADTCQGCYCSEDRHWKCWSVKGACSTFNAEPCTAGNIVKNNLSVCSVCYCGVGGTNMCTTDENCATTIFKHKERAECDSAHCLNNCKKKAGREFGICLKTLEKGCKCVA